MQLVLRVKHRGVSKMAGKIFPISVGLIFLHEEVKPSQRHQKLDSPGGIDNAVLQFCKEAGVREIHHLNGGTLLITTPERLESLGVRKYYDGRSRWFLPYAMWTIGSLDYRIPWISAERVIGDDDFRKKPEPLVKRQPKLL